MSTPRFSVGTRADRAAPRHNLIHDAGSVCGAAWRSVVQRIAATDCTVLVTGETGVGKGFVAREIHQGSARRAGPFVPVNCGAIPESLIDSQLFGHARGAFSGAEKDHPGLVRAAEGGTLLLDEIADLPLAAQTRLLRLLEEREVQPVGYARPTRVNVRIIAATSADLSERVRAGTFREDLFYRLDVVRLHVAPLRERRAEIEPLLEQFNREFASLYRQPLLRLADDAMLALAQHAWPGNVRELRALVERLHVLCGRSAGNDDVAGCAASGGASDAGQTISRDDISTWGGLRIDLHCATSRAAGPVARVGPAAVRIAELKLETVNDALQTTGGNVSRAAISLGVHRSTLYRWLAERERPSV